MIRKTVLLTIICIMMAICFVGCGKQEDTPIIIDELPTAIQVENVDNNLQKTEDEEVLSEADLMLEMRQLRLQRLNSHIPPIGIRGTKIGKIKIPTRPVVPVPIIRHDEELMKKITEMLRESLLRPKITRPVMPFTSRFLYS